MSQLNLVYLALLVSFACSFSARGKKIIYPLQIFTTWVHECAHALMACLLGGTDISIELSPDQSGVTHYRIQKSKLKMGLVASSGYLGASLFGCGLLYLLAQPIEQLLCQILLGLLALSGVFWVRNGFGVASLFAMGAACVVMQLKVVQPYTHFLLLFLAIQTALNSLFDIHTLFGLKKTKKNKSDAHTLQKLFYLPASFWASLWMSASIVLIYFTLRSVLKFA